MLLQRARFLGEQVTLSAERSSVFPDKGPLDNPAASQRKSTRKKAGDRLAQATRSYAHRSGFSDD